MDSLLVRRYQCKRMFETRSRIVPLFPDIMERPGTAQNPTAWHWRYEPQDFYTTIWRIEKHRD